MTAQQARTIAVAKALQRLRNKEIKVEASMNLIRNGKIYFTDKELRCPASGILILAKGFAEALLDLRIAYGRPMAVTSCCRSKVHNAEVGGVPNSQHICDTGRGCCALDVAISNGQDRHALVKLALNMGWSCGIRKDIVHLDRRADFGQVPVVFLYGA